MKVKNTFLSVMAIAVLLVFVSVSCKKPAPTPVSVTNVTLNPSSLTLEIGDTDTLKATVSPDNADNKVITWASSNDSVATVVQGVVTAIAEGTANITVTTQDGNKTATCVVTVIKPHPGEPTMVRVEGGTFDMGYAGEDYLPYERPVHKVTLSSFKISKYPITQKQWKAISPSDNPSYFTANDQNPVEGANWDDVQNFISKLNQITGKNYRLPTEAEWEYAARGGKQSKGYKYSGSNNLNDVAWHNGNSDPKNTHPVGEKLPNELGIYDMSGNVGEWCSDWFSTDYYTSVPQTDPQGPGPSSKLTDRVYRGGSWMDLEEFFPPVSRRDHALPATRVTSIGFRLVLPLD